MFRSPLDDSTRGQDWQLLSDQTRMQTDKQGRKRRRLTAAPRAVSDEVNSEEPLAIHMKSHRISDSVAAEMQSGDGAGGEIDLSQWQTEKNKTGYIGVHENGKNRFWAPRHSIIPAPLNIGFNPRTPDSIGVIS